MSFSTVTYLVAAGVLGILIALRCVPFRHGGQHRQTPQPPPEQVDLDIQVTEIGGPV